MKPITDTYPESYKTDAADLSGCGHAVEFIADAVPEPVIILNHERRLVTLNSAAASALGQTEELLGRLPGEILGCSHAITSHDQCGTMEFCKHCGGNRAIEESLREIKSARE
ncbi:MAG: PAS domain-containing protein [Geovibrio sp.]|nr:PAS domain-containing protein [Geovibrio sp.]